MSEQKDPRTEMERALSKKLMEALIIMRDLTDDDDCHYDHHGYCQAHGWLTDGVCPHKRSKELLTKLGVKL